MPHVAPCCLILPHIVPHADAGCLMLPSQVMLAQQQTVAQLLELVRHAQDTLSGVVHEKVGA